MTGITVLGRAAVFFLTFAAGILVAWLPSGQSVENSEIMPAVNVFGGSGRSGACSGRTFDDSAAGSQPPRDQTALSIISKPRAAYTDLARSKQVNGSVILRVTFLASGKIGAVEPIKTLPDGLTAQAIEAAKGIKFHPKMEAGQPVTVVKKIEYTFTIY